MMRHADIRTTFNIHGIAWEGSERVLHSVRRSFEDEKAQALICPTRAGSEALLKNASGGRRTTRTRSDMEITIPEIIARI